MKQRAIILVDFDPTMDREQAEYRPAVVISQTVYNEKRNMVFICPITSNTRPLRFRVQLDDRTQTQGDILCEQVRVIDLLARECRVVEELPDDLLKRVLEVVGVIIAIEQL